MTPFAAEALASALLAFFGTSVMCNARLPRTAGTALGFGAVAAGWGAALAVALFAVRARMPHANPAVTLALWQLDRVPAAEAWVRVGGQCAGALAGIALAWAAFVPHWAAKRGAAATAAPVDDVLFRSAAIRAPLSNLLSSAIGSGVLAFVMLRVLAGAALADAPGADGADAGFPPATATPFIATHPFEGSLLAGLAFAACVLGVGGTRTPILAQLSVAGRAAHAILPIPGKDRARLHDAWIALAGPALGALAAAALWRATAS